MCIAQPLEETRLMNIHKQTIAPILVGSQVVIGAYSHLNGADAQLTNVAVTRHELEQVARYWLRERLHVAFHAYDIQQIGSYDWRLIAYSMQRLDGIAEALGPERLQAIEQEVIANYRTSWNISDDQWRDFLSDKVAPTGPLKVDGGDKQTE